MWKYDYYKLNPSGVVDLIGITLSTSFTWLTTFVKKHHSFSYSIFFDSPQRLHPNGTFSQYSQNWDSCYFKTLDIHIFFKSNFLKHTRKKSYNLQKYLSNSVLHAPIKNHLTFVLKGFVVESQIFNLTSDFFRIITHAFKFKWTMWRHFRHLHFKTFPMVS
jgi:hypothetical protein